LERLPSVGAAGPASYNGRSQAPQPARDQYGEGCDGRASAKWESFCAGLGSVQVSAVVGI